MEYILRNTLEPTMDMYRLHADLMRETIKIGPGKRSWQTFHRQIGRSRYIPSSGGKRELERRKTI